MKTKIFLPSDDGVLKYDELDVKYVKIIENPKLAIQLNSNIYFDLKSKHLAEIIVNTYKNPNIVELVIDYATFFGEIKYRTINYDRYISLHKYLQSFINHLVVTQKTNINEICKLDAFKYIEKKHVESLRNGILSFDHKQYIDLWCTCLPIPKLAVKDSLTKKQYYETTNFIRARTC